MTELFVRALVLDFGTFLAISFPIALSGLLSFAPGRSVSFLTPAGILVGAYSFVTAYAALGPWGAALLAALAALAAVAGASWALRTTIPWSSLSASFMVASFGLFLIVSNIASILYGDDARVAAAPSYRMVGWTSGGVPASTLLVLILSVLICSAVCALLRFSALGLQIRAMYEDIDLARSLGFPMGPIAWRCFALSGAVAGFAGVLMTIDSHITPSMGLLHFLIALPAILASAGSLARLAAILFGLAAAREVVVAAFGLGWEPAIAIIVILASLALMRRSAGAGR